MSFKIQPIFSSLANTAKKSPSMLQTGKMTSLTTSGDSVSKVASDAISAQALAAINKSTMGKSLNSQDVIRLHNDNRAFVVNLLQDAHKLRMEKYGQDFTAPIKKASKAHINAVYNIQYESQTYNAIQEKLATSQPLSLKEEKLLSFIISQMKPAEQQTTLWRSFYPYKNLEEQLNKGVLEFPFLTSTSRCYNDFYNFWSTSPKPKYVGDRYILEEPIFLKINVPKGKKMLECNVKGTRIPNEVCLPPGKALIRSYDKQANLIEVDYI